MVLTICTVQEMSLFKDVDVSIYLLSIYMSVCLSICLFIRGRRVGRECESEILRIYFIFIVILNIPSRDHFHTLYIDE